MDSEDFFCKIGIIFTVILLLAIIFGCPALLIYLATSENSQETVYVRGLQFSQLPTDFQAAIRKVVDQDFAGWQSHKDEYGGWKSKKGSIKWESQPFFNVTYVRSIGNATEDRYYHFYHDEKTGELKFYWTPVKNG